jgi:predicted nucleotidyltransferase
MVQLTDRQKQKIEKIGKDFNLKLLLIYGSYAKGNQRKDSDLDIAFLGNTRIDFDTYFKLHASLADVFGDVDRALDVVDMRNKDPLFLHQIAKSPRLLYGRTIDYNEFRAFAFRNYMDSKDIRELEKTLVFRYQNYLDTLYASR